MKAIIVDDEIHMKDAIEMMVDWENYEIEEVLYASNGLLALQLIEEKKPELLFCDMEMPVMGGKELLEEIIKRQIRIQVIAISGYSDFQYVHATLLANGVDYILKPFSKETLLHAVQKAVAHIRGEKEEAAKNRQHEQMGITMASQVLQRFCKGESVDGEQVREALNKLGAGTKDFLLVSILNRNAAKVIEERYGGDYDLCFFTVGNILRDMFKTYSFRQEIFVDEFNWQLFLQGDIIEPLRAAEKMKIFEKRIKETLNLEITWVVSNMSVKLEELEKVLAAQNGILQQRNVWGCRMPTEEEKIENTEDISGVLGLELRLSNVMEQKNKEKLYAVIHDYCMGLHGKQLKLQQLQSCTADMNLLIQRIMSVQNMKIRIKPLSVWINDIDVWEEEVKSRLEKMMEHFTEQEEPAEKIFSYIREHYAENITLSTIAGDFYHTPQYVAKIFKNRYDMTVMTAIIQVRMEKSCELLKEGKRSIAQIAELVGYEDENYFSRVFKKNKGVTPAQWRRKYEGTE